MAEIDKSKVRWEDRPDPKAVQWDKPTDPTGSGVQNFLAGIGKTFTDIGLGVRQVNANTGVPQKGDLSSTWQQTQQNMAARSGAIDAEAAEKRAIDRPLMGTGGGLGGAIAGGLLTTLPTAFVPGVNTLGASAAIGGTYGALQPTVGNESRITNTAMGAGGGAAGYGLGRLLSGAVTPAQNNLTPSQVRALTKATDLGAQVTPGTRTGAPGLRQMEAGMESFPFTAGPIKAIKETNQGILNKAAAKAIGETADSVTDDVLNAARSRIGGVFKQTEKIQAIPVDDAVQNSLASIESKYQGLLEKPIAEMPVVQDIYKNLGKSITGKQYNDWQSQLGKIARSKFTGAKSDPNTGFAMFEVKNALDDAASSVMTGAEKQAFKTAQQQWKNLVMLETGNVVNEQSGNVSGRLLSGVLSRKDKTGFRLGGNSSDLYDMARFSKAFPDIVGDSGTATRSAFPLLLGSSAASGLSAGLLTGSPTVGLAAAAAPLAIGGAARAGEAAYLSPVIQAYLANQLLSQGTKRAIGATGGALAAPGLLTYSGNP